MTNVKVVQKIDLLGEICTKFALDWSADNKIAIAADRCVYILTSTLSPVECGFPLPLHKQVIMAPTEILNFKLLRHILPLKDLPVLPEIFLQAALDHTLLPRIDVKPPCLVFRSAKWSPKGASRSGSCYLATLCQDHRLVLYEEENEKWVPIIDISETLHELHKVTWEEEEEIEAAKNENNKLTCSSTKSRPATKSFISIRKLLYDRTKGVAEIEKQKQRIYNLAAIEIIWTNMFSTLSSASDGSYRWCYLITAMKSGMIVWWKVSPDDGERAILAEEWSTGLGILTSLCWQQTSQTSGFLCCGTLSGEVAFIRVSILPEGRDPKLSYESVCLIWDKKDRLSVDHISVLKTSVKQYVIVCNKQHALLTSEMVLIDSELSVKKIGYSEDLINLPVTGCSVLDPVIPQSHILFSCMDNSVFKAKISCQSDAVVTHFETLEVDTDLEHNMIKGLGTSPNGLLCAMILKTAVFCDHLVKREPLQLVVFVTKSYDKILSELAQILKPQFSFIQTPANSLSRYLDYLECARISLATDDPLPELFSSMLNVSENDFEALTLNQMYFTRFLQKAMISNLAISASSLSKKEQEIVKEKMGILEASILTKYIQSVLSSCQDKLDLLTPAQQYSLLVMGDWLYMRYKTPVSLLYEAFGHECPESIEAIPPRESCRICRLPVKLEHFRYGSCAKNHSFSRCCLSLLLCDTVPYYKCPACRSLALQDVWMNKSVYYKRSCVEKPEKGMCLAYFPMFYYDGETGTCKSFVYGGCQGNGNRYETEEECLSTCRGKLHASVDVCALQPETGPCRARMPRFYYDTKSGECKTFTYGGCGGNGNKFETKEECDSACNVYRYEEVKNCSDEPEAGLCRGYFPKYYYDKASGECKEFIYGGCGGNGNNYKTKEACSEACR